MTILSADETRRYARHLVLKDIGGAGQQRLKAARVLVVGAGGLGSPAIAYLVAAGVGRIGVVDDDVVGLSNLQRQIIHRTQDVGVGKAHNATTFATALNPNVAVVSHAVRLQGMNCRYGQGFLFSRAVAAADVPALIRALGDAPQDSRAA